MRNNTPDRAKYNRQQAKWRAAFVVEVGCCQLPDCPGLWPHELGVHEIPAGKGRKPAMAERLACMVACAYCNQERLTDPDIWPVPRQAALQCVLCAHIATPAEVLEIITRCMGNAPTAITWADVAPFLTVKPI